MEGTTTKERERVRIGITNALDLITLVEEMAFTAGIERITIERERERNHSKNKKRKSER